MLAAGHGGGKLCASEDSDLCTAVTALAQLTGALLMLFNIGFADSGAIASNQQDDPENQRGYVHTN